MHKENKNKDFFNPHLCSEDEGLTGFEQHEGWLQIGYKTCKKRKPLLLTFYIFTQYLNMFKRGWDLSCGREEDFQSIKNKSVPHKYIILLYSAYGLFLWSFFSLSL